MRQQTTIKPSSTPGEKVFLCFFIMKIKRGQMELVTESSRKEQDETLYMFLDEGGNFDFSPQGTKYFTLTCLTLQKPFPFYDQLVNVKYDLLEGGFDLQCFHASEDRQVVRDQVFNVIQNNLNCFAVDATIIEKQRTDLALREKGKLYVKVFSSLMEGVLERRIDSSHIRRLLIFTDWLPVEKDREATKKGIKTAVHHYLGQQRIKYFLYHHSSKSNFNLQVVDYINWAIYRKWEARDLRSYDLIKRGTLYETEFCGGSGRG